MFLYGCFVKILFLFIALITVLIGETFADCSTGYFPSLETEVTRKYIYCDTAAELPSSGMTAGDLLSALDTGKFYVASSTTTFGTTASKPSADDQVRMSDSATETTWRAVNNCTGAGKALTYATATNTYGCNTITGGGEAFPVGSVFIAVVSTDPATLLGYGTWSAIGAGKMLVGLDSGDTDFDAAEETGGAKTKTIAQANLPNISTGAGTSHNHTQDAHTHQTLRERSATTGGATTLIARTSDTSSTVDTNVFMENATATNQAEAAHTHSLGGSGTALNVVNPYFVVYMWKRTA